MLSSDEKDYVFEPKRPAKRRYNLALKSLVLLGVLVLHAGLIVVLARWLGAAFPWAAPRPAGATTSTFPTEPKYGFEGVLPAVYKDPTAEFVQVNPCGHSAEEARARGCRYGMLYGAWLPEECYDEETEERFKHYTNWRFWLQPNRTQEVSWDEVARGEFEYVLVEWECKLILMRTCILFCFVPSFTHHRAHAPFFSFHGGGKDIEIALANLLLCSLPRRPSASLCRDEPQDLHGHDHTRSSHHRLVLVAVEPH